MTRAQLARITRHLDEAIARHEQIRADWDRLLAAYRTTRAESRRAVDAPHRARRSAS